MNKPNSRQVRLIRQYIAMGYKQIGSDLSDPNVIKLVIDTGTGKESVVYITASGESFLRKT